MGKQAFPFLLPLVFDAYGRVRRTEGAVATEQTRLPSSRERRGADVGRLVSRATPVRTSGV